MPPRSRPRHALLYIDLLGVRARWRREGRPGAEAAFQRLSELLENALAATTSQPISGGIESDSFALAFEDPAKALHMGIELFLAAFAVPIWGEPMWLRGVIGLSSNAPLRTESAFDNPRDHIARFTYSGELLDAIAAERSWFQGMRLLIDRSFVNRTLREEFAVPVGTAESFIPFKALNHSHYPDRIAAQYDDVLWMACTGTDDWKQRQRQMADRLRHAAADAEEFLHAAATQVVFNEVEAIVRHLQQGARPPRRQTRLRDAPRSRR